MFGNYERAAAPVRPRRGDDCRPGGARADAGGDPQQIGPPDFLERYAHRVDLGYGARSRPRVEVIVNGTAWALEFEDPTDEETKLGRVLALPPRTLERRIAATYPGEFRLVRSYHCDPKGCFGLFLDNAGERSVIFGNSRGKRYVGLQLTQPPTG